jgi:hypothetical protein
MRMRQILAMLGVLSAVTLPGLSRPVQAQPSVDQVLSDFGVSSDDKQRVMNGEFVTPDLSNVSDRDLAVAVIFLVKTTPDSLAKQIITGDPSPSILKCRRTAGSALPAAWRTSPA